MVQILDNVYLTDFIPEFKRIKESLENYNLIIIVGDEGTGKTGFINNYFNNLNDVLINRVDSNTSKTTILSFLRNRNIFYSKKILIYDDISIKADLLKEASKYVHLTRSNKKFIVIINNLKKKPNKYVVHKTRYPTKNEVYRYIQDTTFHRVRRNPPEKPIDDELKKEILKMDIYNMRRIQYAIDDGFITEEEKIEESDNITEKSPYIISYYIAENLYNLKRIKNEIIDADKLKNVNKRFYSDFIKLHYPNIDKKRLRYPKMLLDIMKNR